MEYFQVDKIDPQSAGKGLAVLATALIFRMIGVVFAVSGGNLNKKEKIFMAFAWLPKAAVQVDLVRCGLLGSVWCALRSPSPSCCTPGRHRSRFPRQREEVQQTRVGTYGTRNSHLGGVKKIISSFP